MNGAFSIALSSLQGNQDAISATGQNLANLNTTGYKGNAVAFRDLVAQSASATPGSQQGLGISKPIVQTFFSDGATQASTSAFAAAIQGDGFFYVRNAADGRQLFTRDGNFVLDKDGYLKTLSGEVVQGWNENDGVLDTTGANPSNIKLNANTTSAPIATTAMSFTANLNAASSNAAGSLEIAIPITAIDSLGASHTVQVTFSKTATTGSWDYSVSIPGDDLTAGTPGAPSVLQTGSVSFNADGTLASHTEGGVTSTPSTPVIFNAAGLKNGANDLNITWSLASSDTAQTPLLTQFAEKSQYDKPSQDGIPSGQITKVGMAAGGQIVATFSNGQTRAVAQLGLAKFVNNDALIPVGNNNFSASVFSSEVSIGTAGTKGIGESDVECA